MGTQHQFNVKHWQWKCSQVVDKFEQNDFVTESRRKPKQ